MARIFCQNVNTTTGAKLRRIRNETNMNPFIMYKQTMNYHRLPLNEYYKINMIKELIDVKFGIYSSILDSTQIDDVLQHLCCS